MKKVIFKSSYFLFLASLILVFANSCTHIEKQFENFQDLTAERNAKEIKIYFTKSKSKGNIVLYPVTRKISKEDSVIDSALKELFLGPTKAEELKGVMTEIPVGTRLIQVEESEDEILIDVSSQFLTGGGSATMQLRYLQLYRTFKNVALGKKLYLNIDGKYLKTIGGEGLEVSRPLMTINDYTQKYETPLDLQP